MADVIKLSKNFWTHEFERSDTAVRLGIDNTIPNNIVSKLEILVCRVLQPARDHFVSKLKRGRSVQVRSGYRCPELNSRLGSSSRSQHPKGEAADIEIMGVDNYELACWIRDNLDFDQLILEFYDGNPNSGWVHVSYNEGNNRQECLTINKSIKLGLVK